MNRTVSQYFLIIGHSVDYVPEIDALFVYGGYLEPQKLHVLYNVKSAITPDANKEPCWEEGKSFFSVFRSCQFDIEIR